MLYLKVWGDRACFSCMKTERFSYPVPTPAAIRGIFESIFYKPEFKWQPVRTAIKKPIQYDEILKNELKESKVNRNNAKTGVLIGDQRTQRLTCFLKQVEYVFEVKITNILTNNFWNNTYEKFREMFESTLDKGQSYCQPFLGQREFVAYFEKSSFEEFNTGNIDYTGDIGVIQNEVFEQENKWQTSKGVTRTRTVYNPTTVNVKIKEGIAYYEYTKPAIQAWEAMAV